MTWLSERRRTVSESSTSVFLNLVIYHVDSFGGSGSDVDKYCDSAGMVTVLSHHMRQL